MSNISNTPSVSQYPHLLSAIETGRIKIPRFQRRFVWSLIDSARLIDSVIKGYPVGTFIYWRTNERLRSIRDLGGIDLPEPPDGETVNYVLDGQQRLTSLFATIKGLEIIDDAGKLHDYSQVYVRLHASSDEPVVVVGDEVDEPKKCISLRDLMFGNIPTLAAYPEELLPAIQTYRQNIESYLFSIITIDNAPIDTATEVFTRLNVGGKALTLFEVMVAKTYDAETEFDLADEFETLVSELQERQYETIPATAVLQLVAAITHQECTRRAILSIDRQSFIEGWRKAVDALKAAIDFLRGYGVSVSRILPYNAIVVPIGYYFHLHPHSPAGDQLHLLEDFFWRVGLGFRYSSGLESKLGNDLRKIEKIANGIQPHYEWAIDIDPESIIKNGWFATGRSYIKAILCLLTKIGPRSFDNNLQVNIDNSWLKIATSKNYHHFFPKAYLRAHQPDIDQFHVNNVVNITIVDDFLNKRRIRAKAPSDYLSEFSALNSSLEQTMATHLVNLSTDGVWTNDYWTFFNARAQRISMELHKFLIPQPETASTNLEHYTDDDDFQEPITD